MTNSAVVGPIILTIQPCCRWSVLWRSSHAYAGYGDSIQSASTDNPGVECWPKEVGEMFAGFQRYLYEPISG